ncbi:hypothetical protein D3C72_819430 [compost metagenome]
MLCGDKTNAFLKLGDTIASECNGLPGDYDKVSKAIESLENENKSLATQISDIRSTGISKKFVIGRQFDTDSSGNAYYEAVDMDRMQKCIIAVKDGQLNTHGYGAIRLSVESLGTQAVSVDHHNAYRSYSSTEYYPTYKVADNRQEIERFEQQQHENWEQIAQLQDKQAQFEPRFERLKSLIQQAEAHLP